MALQGFGGPLLSPPQAGLDQLLRSVGQMLQDADKREALKGAVATLIQTTATVGKLAAERHAKDAVESGAGLPIEASGVQSASAQ